MYKYYFSQEENKTKYGYVIANNMAEAVDKIDNGKGVIFEDEENEKPIYRIEYIAEIETEIDEETGRLNGKK